MEIYIFGCFKRLRIVAVQKSMFVSLGCNTILYIVQPWIASIIRSRNVLVIQNTRISK
jgi:hypothetical protein